MLLELRAQLTEQRGVPPGGDLLLLEAPQHRQVCDVFTLAKRMEFSLQLYLISAKFGRLGTHRPEFAK